MAELTSQFIAGRTVSLLRGNARRVTIAFLAMTVAAVLAESTEKPAEFNLIASGLNFAMLYWLTGALLEDLGRRVSDRGRLGAAFGLCLLTNLGIILGLVLLIVPGIILAVRWTISLPYLLGEDVSISDAVAGSWEETRDSFWAIFLTLLLFYSPVVVAAFIAYFLEANDLGTLPGSIVTNALMSAAQIAGWHAAVAIYLARRPETGLAELFA